MAKNPISRHLRPRLLFVLGAFLLLTTSGCWNEWRDTYRWNDDEPFDLYALYELLEARPEGLEMITDSISATATGNYLYVGNDLFLSDDQATNLLNFVEEGNVAFIAANRLPEPLAVELFSADCFYLIEDRDRYDWQYVEGVTAILGEPYRKQFDIHNVSFGRRGSNSMVVLNANLFCDEGIENEVIGTLNDGTDTTELGVNFVRLPWGEGRFYLLTTPRLLTNYYLDDPAMGGYAEQALGFLGPGPVLWDEVHRKPPFDDPQANPSPYDPDGGRRLLSGNEALRYIQENRALSLAWYLLVAAGLAFVVFRGKRRQRIVPEIARRANTSQRFVDAMSRLLLQKGNHLGLAQREMNNLRFFLRERYQVRWREGEAPPEDLSELTGLDGDAVARALYEIRFVQQRISEGASRLSEGELVRFYRAVNALYL